MNNQWHWRVPVSAIQDDRITNFTNVIVAINKINDLEIRTDGERRIDILGDNLEFLKIEDGFIDLSRISRWNKTYIESELREFLWFTIVVPKFFHEYPIMLPTDIIHRPYEPDLRPVMVMREDTIQRVKTNSNSNILRWEPNRLRGPRELMYDAESIDLHLGMSPIREETGPRQVYIDMNGRIADHFDGWKSMIRPIVLSDAFENPMVEPYDSLIEEIRNLRDVTDDVAEIIGVNTRDDRRGAGAGRLPDDMNIGFRTWLRDSFVDKETLDKYLAEIKLRMNILQDTRNAFFDKRRAHHCPIWLHIYTNEFLVALDDISKRGELSNWFHSREVNRNFWETSSNLITMSRAIV
jgi:hypothetical protein